MSEVAEKPKHLGLHARIENKMLPEISDELLAEMAAHITPLMKSGTENPNYFTISNLPEELRNVSFLWGAKPGEAVGRFDVLDSVDIMTFHRWGYYGFFKPSIAEVMACVHAFVSDWKEVKYFYLNSEYMGPENIIGDFQWCRCELYGGPPRMMKPIGNGAWST
jgi:hypothetical protein